MLSLLLDSYLAFPAKVTGGTIVGGVPVDPFFKYPWLVSLQSQGSHYCGGILLNSKFVLTAGHCSTASPPYSDWTVHAHRFNISKDDPEENGLRFKVLEMKSHPNFTTSHNGFDVAIWKIEKTSGSDNFPSFKLELDDGTWSKENQILGIAGWGTTESGGDISPLMLETQVPISTDSACKTAYSYVVPSSICAGLTTGGKDTCQGDSGGPLFHEKDDGTIVLVGTTSYGRGCALPKYPGVYSRISDLSIQKFIKSYL